MPSGDRAIRIPVNLCIVVGVQIHEAWSDYTTRCIQRAHRGRVLDAADLADPSVLDAHVGTEAWQPGAVDYCPTANDQIVFGHSIFLPPRGAEFEVYSRYSRATV